MLTDLAGFTPWAGLGTDPVSEMRTITFYSDKGGTGRTLALANVARQLARFGQKVIVVDFDLEAPGLHCKFAAGEDGEPPEITTGVVDYLNTLMTTGRVPKSVLPFVTNVVEETEQGGRVDLIAAGPSLLADYWKKQRRINWHNLLGDPPDTPGPGVPALLELKEQIREELKPAFLLIDSRAGVTEAGGIVTGILADQVICFLVNNRENLDGSRMVMRSFRGAWRPPGMERVDIDVALSRLPYDAEGDGHAGLLEEVRTFLNEDAEVLEHTLAIVELLVLHSEPSLLTNERLFLASGGGTAGLPLHIDYQRLFERIVPTWVSERGVGPAIAAAWRGVGDDPARTQRELEEIAQFRHVCAMQELVKFHLLGPADAEVVGVLANRLWDATKDSDDTVLWRAARYVLTSPPSAGDEPTQSVATSFLTSVWAGAGGFDVEAGLALADLHSRRGDYDSAAACLQTLASNVPDSGDAIGVHIDALSAGGSNSGATALLRGFRGNLALNPPILRALARHALSCRDQELMAAGAAAYATVAAVGLPDPASVRLAVALHHGARTDPIELEAPLAASLPRIRYEEIKAQGLGDLAKECLKFGFAEAFLRALAGHPDEALILEMVPSLR